MMTNNIHTHKKGFTLVEVIVAMTIFLVVLTLAVSAFISVSNMKALTSTMKEVQQKTRIATEMIIRLSRQSDKVIITDNGKAIELYYNLQNNNPNFGYRFDIVEEGGQLKVSECSMEEGITSCGLNEWEPKGSLLGDSVTLNYADSYFTKKGTIPPTLEVNIKGVITTINDNPYYSNDLTIVTSVALEGIK